MTDPSGNAVITGDGCYEVTQEGSTIKLHGKCVACCQCQAYIDILDTLKIVARKIEGVKDKEIEQSNTYFDFVDKFEVQTGRPEIDVQLDIVPDSGIYAAANKSGKISTAYATSHFIITCTVTNLSGVPVLFAVPDKWNEGEYWNSGIQNISGNIGNKLSKNPADILKMGIQAIVSNNVAAPMSFGTTINPNNKSGSANGSLVYYDIRGPVTRFNSGDKQGYVHPGIASDPGWKSKIKPAEDWNRISAMAISDLNKGKNPSYMYDEISALIMTSAGDGTGGFVMPAGYSFTITNAYEIPSSRVTGKYAVCAVFRGCVYAPVLMYSKAYNWARSTVTSSKVGNDIVYKNTWSLDASPYARNYNGSDLFRPVASMIAYSFADGKKLIYSSENGIVIK